MYNLCTCFNLKKNTLKLQKFQYTFIIFFSQNVIKTNKFQTTPSKQIFLLKSLSKLKKYHQIRIELLTGTVPFNKLLLGGTVLVNQGSCQKHPFGLQRKNAEPPYFYQEVWTPPLNYIIIL